MESSTPTIDNKHLLSLNNREDTMKLNMEIVSSEHEVKRSDQRALLNERELQIEISLRVIETSMNTSV
ncbi:CLUMA_CG014994, isoform A [Clunio marinus]|uniref:CLUMA_CG014994, isoform A n=1 Tax=Clunio marinus TaxID=568069 RepID=A0A1J1IPX8_9DIPT|nr:CLUMA_CG014994, isoform A [Clunio marinus]